MSHDITVPDHVFFIGGCDLIDDKAPLAGIGSSTVPELATLAVLGLGLAALGFPRRRKSA